MHKSVTPSRRHAFSWTALGAPYKIVAPHSLPSLTLLFGPLPEELIYFPPSVAMWLINHTLMFWLSCVMHRRKINIQSFFSTCTFCSRAKVLAKRSAKLLSFIMLPGFLQFFIFKVGWWWWWWGWRISAHPCYRCTFSSSLQSNRDALFTDAAKICADSVCICFCTRAQMYCILHSITHTSEHVTSPRARRMCESTPECMCSNLCQCVCVFLFLFIYFLFFFILGSVLFGYWILSPLHL